MRKLVVFGRNKDHPEGADGPENYREQIERLKQARDEAVEAGRRYRDQRTEAYERLDQIKVQRDKAVEQRDKAVAQRTEMQERVDSMRDHRDKAIEQRDKAVGQRTELQDRVDAMRTQRDRAIAQRDRSQVQAGELGANRERYTAFVAGLHGLRSNRPLHAAYEDLLQLLDWSGESEAARRIRTLGEAPATPESELRDQKSFVQHVEAAVDAFERADPSAGLELLATATSVADHRAVQTLLTGSVERVRQATEISGAPFALLLNLPLEPFRPGVDLDPYVEAVATAALLQRAGIEPPESCADALESLSIAEEPARSKFEVVDRAAFALHGQPCAGVAIVTTHAVPNALAGSAADVGLCPPGVTPIFIGFRLEDERVLDDDSKLELLRLHAPIACGDLFTATALEGRGIEVVLSGPVERVAASLWTDTVRDDGHVVTLARDADEQLAVVPMRVPGLERRPLDARLGRAVSAVRSILDAASTPDEDTLATELLGGRADPTAHAVAEALVRTLRRVAETPHRTAEIWAEEAADLARFDSGPPERVPVVHSTEPEHPHGDPIHLAVATDQNLAPYLWNLLKPVDAYASRECVVHLLGRGLDDDELARLGDALTQTEIIHYDMASYDFAGGLLGSHITVSTFDRLALETLVDESVRRIAYLDMDLLIRGDVAALHDLDLAGAAAGARWIPQMNVDRGDELARQRASALPLEARADFYNTMRSVHPSLGYQVFNAGVMVFSLDRIREMRMWETVRDWPAKYALNDQDVLNFFLGADVAPLPPELHCIPWDDPTADPVIVHYPGPRKPWNEPALRWAGEWAVHGADERGDEGEA